MRTVIDLHRGSTIALLPRVAPVESLRYRKLAFVAALARSYKADRAQADERTRGDTGGNNTVTRVARGISRSGNRGHIKRTRNYVKVLAERLRRQPRFQHDSDDETIDLLYISGPLHDIGKVGIRDEILLKLAKLTSQEFEEMKKHTTHGRDALAAAEVKFGSNSFLRFAREIAGTPGEMGWLRLSEGTVRLVQDLIA